MVASCSKVWYLYGFLLLFLQGRESRAQSLGGVDTLALARLFGKQFPVDSDVDTFCTCFSRAMLDTILSYDPPVLWWSDVPGCKLKPYHEMYEFVVRFAGAPDHDFNFCAQAGMVDSMPFASVDLFNNNTGRLEFHCGGPTTEALAAPCTRILRAFIAELRIKRLEADYCGQQGSIPKGFVITRPPPFWMTMEFLLPMTVLVFLIGFAFALVLRRSQIERKNRILQEQAHIIEKQRSIEAERNRISSELHDELGSGLTSIRYLSDRGIRDCKDSGDSQLYKQILGHSQKIIETMGEIVWAMNTRFDHAPYLTSYIRHFASTFAEEHELTLQFMEGEGADSNGRVIPGIIRRNVFFVFKEILHNISKPSGCHGVVITVTAGERYSLRITEKGGKGFEPVGAMHLGNGLFNIRKRMEEVNGEFNYTITPQGVDFMLSVPIN